MRASLMKHFSLLVALLVITCTLSVNGQGFGQGRGKGRGLNKKSERFINGHDARDGRWDGRGPRAGLTRYRLPDRIKYSNRGWTKRSQKGKKVRGVYKRRW